MVQGNAMAGLGWRSIREVIGVADYHDSKEPDTAHL